MNAQRGTTTLLSHNAANPSLTANAPSNAARISGDGHFVVFTSQATDLVSGQSGSGQFKNVFLYNRLTGTTTLVSHDVSSPALAGNADSDTAFTTGFGSTNTVGRYLLFHSSASDLISGQTGPSHQNLFVYDTSSGTTRLVSHNLNSLTAGADDDTVGQADISGDGNFIAYNSFADDAVANLIDVNGSRGNIFVYDNSAAAHPNTLVTGIAVSNPGGGPTVSANVAAGTARCL